MNTIKVIILLASMFGIPGCRLGSRPGMEQASRFMLSSASCAVSRKNRESE